MRAEGAGAAEPGKMLVGYGAADSEKALVRSEPGGQRRAPVGAAPAGREKVPAYIAFTERGKTLADALSAALGGEAARCGEPLGLRDWTAVHFSSAGALVFVGAAGIAVRAIAPYVRDKAADPAVVVVDERGRFAIPILSGHLGGANDLARAIGRVCGATPVLTTATDINGVFAVDEWARRQNCFVADVGKIKEISGRLLAGGTVRVRSDWPIEGDPPPGVSLTAGNDCDVWVSIGGGKKVPGGETALDGKGAPGGETALDGKGDPGGEAALCGKRAHDGEEPHALLLIPRIAVLGVGCRRGTTRDAMEAALASLLVRSGLSEQAFCAAATIDMKQNEPGLKEFCAAHGWRLEIYSADQLRNAAGSFTASAFVEQVTGVDNVCERAAVLAAGGPLYWNKDAGNGVAMAVALKPFCPNWRWRDE